MQNDPCQSSFLLGLLTASDIYRLEYENLEDMEGEEKDDMSSGLKEGCGKASNIFPGTVVG